MVDVPGDGVINRDCRHTGRRRLGEHLGYRNVRKVEGLGHGFVRQGTFVHIEPERQSCVIGQGLPPALVGQYDGVREGHVCERVGGGVWNGTRHIRDAVEHRIMHPVRRVVVRGRARVLEAPALVNGNVDEH